MSHLFSHQSDFVTTIEVVPPVGNNPETLLEKLCRISTLTFQAFSVATNPVAKPRMSAMVFSYLLQKNSGKKTMLHFTTRDHNRLAIQSELWGAKALGVDTVIAVTGDSSAAGSGGKTTTVADLSVFELIEMANDSDMNTGAVLDFRPEINGLENEIKRLRKKVNHGCQFIVTQPLYDEPAVQQIYSVTKDLGVPVIMGILPLLSYKHAAFLHHKVAGIDVPTLIRKQMKDAENPVTKGIQNARQMLGFGKNFFSGVCIMPPFDRFDIMKEILTP